MDAGPLLLQRVVAPQVILSLLLWGISLTLYRYIHETVWRDEDIRVIHYILKDKPWLDRPPVSDKEQYEETKRWWWASYGRLLESLSKDGRDDDIQYIEGQVGPKTHAQTPTLESIV